MAVGFLDLTSGISGDMFLGALVDAGAPLETMQEAVRAVAGDRLALRVREVRRAGLRGKQVEVLVEGKRIHESGGPGPAHPNGASDQEPSRPDATRVHHGHGTYTGIVEHEQQGLLFPRKDPEALASALARLIENIELARRLGAKGRETVEQYRWSVVASQVEAYYEDCLRASHDFAGQRAV